MQAIQEQHAQAVYEAHILALKTLTDLLQRTADPTEQRRISAIILRTKPTPPKPADQPPAPPKPRTRPAKPSRPLLADILSDDEEEDDDLDPKGLTPSDIDMLRHLMLATAPPPPAAPTSHEAGNHHPSS